MARREARFDRSGGEPYSDDRRHEDIAITGYNSEPVIDERGKLYLRRENNGTSESPNSTSFRDIRDIAMYSIPFLLCLHPSPSIFFIF